MFIKNIGKGFLLGVAILSLVFSFSPSVFADNSSSNTSLSVTSTSGIGFSWTDPANASTTDDTYATASFSSSEDPENQNTNGLNATGFGFSIPSNATIEGIKVEVEKHASVNDANTNVKDISLKLIKSDGVTVAENKADNVTGWSTDDSFVSYGGENDLWGEVWTPADINSSNFGVSLFARLHATGTNSTASVDSFNITVFYSLPVLATININPATLSIAIPNTGKLTAETLDQYGAPISATLTWSSDDENIATVDQNGLVTAVSVGTANITASSGSISSSIIPVNITPRVSSGGGGGGGSVIHRPQNTQSLPPGVGEVLGAKIFLFEHDLKLGSKGDDVSELQKRLTGEGLYSGPITKTFGPLTLAGVKKFQAKYGIIKTGVVGPITRAKLNSLNLSTNTAPCTEGAKFNSETGKACP